MRVAGAAAIVTGGASGLGAGTVRALVEAGAKAAILDLPTSAGAALADELGPAAAFVPVDVRDADRVEAAVGEAAAVLGRVDLCVNAAGVGPAHRVVSREGDLFPLDLFRSVLEINLIGLFDVTRWAAWYMSDNDPNEDGERGLIVNVASIAAFEGQVGQAAYSASKAGVVGMTLPLARDLAGRGIRVMAIAPGIMDTPMLAGAPADLRASLAQVHVFPRRLGRSEEFARLVVAIAENPLLNGEVIRLDAGARMGPR